MVTLPAGPHRNDAGRHVGKLAEFHPALAGAVPVGSAGCFELESPRIHCELDVLRLRMRRRKYLDRVAAEIAKLGEQPTHTGAFDLVTARMGDHSLPSGGVNPADDFRERGPRVRHVAGFATSQIALEDVLRLARKAGLHQIAREVRARNE